MKITSLSISGPTYGIGHTSRQHALLEAAQFEGWKTSHFVINELNPLLPQLDELLADNPEVRDVLREEVNTKIDDLLMVQQFKFQQNGHYHAK